MSAHTPGPWRVVNNGSGWSASYEGNGCTAYQGIVDADGSVIALAVDHRGDHSEPMPERHSALLAAAPDLLAACINARDMLATDRQAFVDCQQLRDARTDDPIACGLVCVADGVWIAPEDAEPLRDYDRALALIDAATAKATGAAL